MTVTSCGVCEGCLSLMTVGPCSFVCVLPEGWCFAGVCGTCQTTEGVKLRSESHSKQNSSSVTCQAFKHCCTQSIKISGF